jgi:hypothetical protein
MSRVVDSLALSATLVLAGSGAALAHHSYAMFDKQKVLQIDGTVRTLQWTNPHVYIWMYVPNAKGAQDVWGIELGAGPNALERHGWTRNTVHPGDKVSLKLNPLKDGRTGGLFLNVTLPDGKTMGLGGSNEGG